MNETYIAVAIILFVVIVVVHLASMTTFYVKCPPTKILIRTGVGGFISTKDSGLYIIPVLHQGTFLSLLPLRIEIDQNFELLDGHRIFNIMISDDYTLLKKAFNRMAGLNEDEIKELAKDIILSVAESDIQSKNIFDTIDEKLNEVGLTLLAKHR